MRRLTIVLIPEGAHATRQFTFPKVILTVVSASLFLVAGVMGFLLLDYVQLRKLRDSYYMVSAENEGLKGEARLLMSNLEEVKTSLRRVQDYSAKLGDLTNIKVRKMSKATGIGPLTPDEVNHARKNAVEVTDSGPSSYMPLGIDMDKLVFRPVFDSLTSIGNQAQRNALELQQLLSNLSQQKSLLSSIPSITPVNGWITSGFGTRVSPFTGERTSHMGVDVAAPIGSPIYAPADGVVIFSGAKVGFGNFAMIAHGYGVVTRYGHNAQNMVQAGQKVKRGEQIATVGMTGRTTGPHLHYEIMVNGQYVDPKKFLLDHAD